jgi:hypothetical protein
MDVLEAANQARLAEVYYNVMQQKQLKASH